MALLSNLSYMDHNDTKLCIKCPLDEHSINSDVAVIIGNTSSSNKSHFEHMVKIVSSEPTHIIRTEYLEEPDGCQLLPRTMLNTWTQGEDDESETGSVMTQIKQSKFKLLLIGQIRVMEFICVPQQQGFQKRMSMVYYPQNVMEYDFQASDDWCSLIHQIHSDMHRYEMPALRKPYLSGHAQSMCTEFKQVVGEGIEEHRSEHLRIQSC